jgi:hypothetical protein
MKAGLPSKHIKEQPMLNLPLKKKIKIIFKVDEQSLN